jgi:hypothetical protein
MVVMMRFHRLASGRVRFWLVFASYQFSAKELAHVRFRYIAHEQITTRTLEFGETRGLAKPIELDFRDSAAALDESGDYLAPALVRKADDSNFRYSRMERQAAFDFDR